MDTINKTPAVNPLSSLLIARPAPVCLADAVNKPAPKMLMNEFWHQGELSVLFGNSGTGKSLLAVQMAEAICRGEAVKGFKTEVPAQKVLYFDFDTSDRQFAARYPDYQFSDNFIRVTINREHWELKKFGEQLFAAMEEAIKQHEAKVIVIDSLSTLKYLVNDLFFLTRLLQLKSRLKLSVLLLAGTKKPQPGRPFTLGNLAANKMVVGMADSVLALGASKLEENGRYLVQLKGKEMGAVYHQTHVVTGRNAVTPLPGFEVTGYGTEQAQLALPLSMDSLEAKILEYRSKAPRASLAEIAKWLGTNKMKVKRVLERYDGVESEILNSKSENRQPADPFRGDVGLSNHTSKSGVKSQSSPNVPEIKSQKSEILNSKSENRQPTDPFRGDVGLSNHTSKSGVKNQSFPNVPEIKSQKSEILNSKSENRQPSDPFRGDVKLSNHTSKFGVKNQSSPNVPEIKSQKSEILNSKSENHQPTDPFRCDVGLSNHTSKSGVKNQSSPNVPEIKSQKSEILNSKSENLQPTDPFRGGVKLSNHTSKSGVKKENQSPELPVNTAVTLVTPDDDLDDLVFEIRYDEPGPKKPSYSEQLRKRLHQASQQRKGGKKK